MSMGRLISVEGIEGAGKSTLVESIAAFLRSHDITVCQTREPGGTPVAESIRHLLLHAHPHEPLTHRAELLLMFASRIQHIEMCILPALQRGEWVICDRFVDASFAYQGGGRGLGLEQIEPIAAWSMGGLEPDLTLLLDLPVEQAMQRLQGRHKDKIEQENLAFFEAVRSAYLVRAQQMSQRFLVLDATVSADTLALQAHEAVKRLWASEDD